MHDETLSLALTPRLPPGALKDHKKIKLLYLGFEGPCIVDSRNPKAEDPCVSAVFWATVSFVSLLRAEAEIQRPGVKPQSVQYRCVYNSLTQPI